MEQMEIIFICNLTEEGQTHSIYYLICLSSFSYLMFEEEKYRKRFTKHADFLLRRKPFQGVTFSIRCQSLN